MPLLPLSYPSSQSSPSASVRTPETTRKKKRKKSPLLSDHFSAEKVQKQCRRIPADTFCVAPQHKFGEVEKALTDTQKFYITEIDLTGNQHVKDGLSFTDFFNSSFPNCRVLVLDHCPGITQSQIYDKHFWPHISVEGVPPGECCSCGRIWEPECGHWESDQCDECLGCGCEELRCAECDRADGDFVELACCDARIHDQCASHSANGHISASFSGSKHFFCMRCHKSFCIDCKFQAKCISCQDTLCVGCLNFDGANPQEQLFYCDRCYPHSD